MIGIRSIGWWVPEARRSASQMAEDYHVSKEAIAELGIESHAVPGDDDHPLSMSVRATQSALEAAELSTDDLDLVIYIGVTKDWPSPWIAAMGIIHELDARHATGFDLLGRCAGINDALWVAKHYIASGTYKTIAICAAERFDYMLGPPRKAEMPMDVFYSAGAATAIIRADADNEICGFSSYTNPDISSHRVVCPLMGGSRIPPSKQALDDNLHHWKSQFTIQDSANMEDYFTRADRYNITALKKQGKFEDIDFVVCTPFFVEPQLASLDALGIDARSTPLVHFTLGHIGSADILIILAVSILTERNVGRRIVLSARAPLYSSMTALSCEKKNELGIALSGQGVDASLWKKED